MNNIYVKSKRVIEIQKANHLENYKIQLSFSDGKDMRINVGYGAILFSEKYYVGVSSPHFYYGDINSIKKNRISNRISFALFIEGIWLI